MRGIDVIDKIISLGDFDDGSCQLSEGESETSCFRYLILIRDRSHKTINIVSEQLGGNLTIPNFSLVI